MNKTNIEFVTDLMERSKYGALSQVFVIEAIQYYSNLIANQQPKENANSLINPMAWHGIAVEIQQKIKSEYE